MIRVGLQAALFVICGMTTAAAQDAAGNWRTHVTKAGYLEVAVAPCGAALCATIVRAFNPQGVEGTAADFPHIGRQIFWDMQPDAAGRWANGKIWDPVRDRTFNAKMHLADGALNVSGCFLAICESYAWQPAR